MFSLKNVRDLYAQYTEETNQPFRGEAVKKVYEETAGQPWLVNRLGKRKGARQDFYVLFFLASLRVP